MKESCPHTGGSAGVHQLPRSRPLADDAQQALDALVTRGRQVIRAFYLQFGGAGTPTKLVLIACMRKLLVTLNAMVARQVPWTAHPLIPARLFRQLLAFVFSSEAVS